MNVTLNHPSRGTPEQLSSAWLFILLTMIFRDLHEFGRPGFIQEIESGIVGGVVITEGLMLFGGVLATLPIAMAVFTRYLPRLMNCWANGIVAVLNAALLAPNLLNDLDDIYFTSLQMLAFAFILWKVLRWKD